jgi:hypothetical protein
LGTARAKEGSGVRMGGGAKANMDIGCSSSTKGNLNSVENQGGRRLSVILKCSAEAGGLYMGDTGNASGD